MTVWSIKNFKQVLTLKKHEYLSACMDDGRVMLRCGDGAIRAWEITEPFKVFEIEDPGPILLMNSYQIIATSDTSIKTWSMWDFQEDDFPPYGEYEKPKMCI